jgi:Glycosyl hydrolase family 9/Cellulase N-terminal ig-like domain
MTILNMQNPISVNHVGFMTEAYKTFIISSPPEEEFSVYELKDNTHTQVYSGRLYRANGSELGEGWIGDFTDFKKEGIYQIRCGALQGRCFIICDNPYEIPMRLLVNFFEWQKCGDNTSGWNAPCHLDDGIIAETGEHRDYSGGFHQSGDHRKWASGTSLALIGLTQFALNHSSRWDHGCVAELIQWGSTYFQKLMREDGGIVDSSFIPIGWGAREYYLSDTQATSMWNILRFQAVASEFFKSGDKLVSDKCLAAARRIWDHMTSPARSYELYNHPHLPPIGHEGANVYYHGEYKDSALELSHRLCAAISMHRATGDSRYLEDACACATKLAGLQIGGDVIANPAAGCFRNDPASDLFANVYFYLWNTSAPIGFCDILEAKPNHPNAKLWKQCIYNIAEQNRIISKRNPWGLAPATWYMEDHYPFTVPAFYSFSNIAEATRKGYPGGHALSVENASIDTSCNYRYYHYVYNMELAATGIFMKKAASILEDPDYLNIAQRQLDWILGSNPFDASSIEGVGYNQPHRGVFGEFFPPVPQIPGAVFIGLTEHSFDPDGFGQDNEYDIPIAGWILWLMSVIGKGD